jgi:hypothetical protein
VRPQAQSQPDHDTTVPPARVVALQPHERPQIVDALRIRGRKFHESTLSRLYNHSPTDIDVAGVSELLLEVLFDTVSGVALRTAQAERYVRLATSHKQKIASSQKATEEALAHADNRFRCSMTAAEHTVRTCQKLLTRLTPPRNEIEREEHANDSAGLEALQGQIALYKKNPADGLVHMQRAWQLTEPLAQKRSSFNAATYQAARSSSNAFFAAHPPEPIIIPSPAAVQPGTPLYDIVRRMVTLPFFKLAKLSVSTMKDERLAANFAQAFAFGGQAAMGRGNRGPRRSG